MAWSLVFGVVSVGLAILLVWTTTQLNQSTDHIVRDTESWQISDELELGLLTYNRVSNLLASSGHEELATVQATMQSNIHRLLSRASGYLGGEGEERQLAEVGRQIQRYFDERDSLEARSLPLDQLIQKATPSLERALAEVHTLRSLNQAQVRESHEAASRLDAISNLLGISSAVVLVLGIASLLLGMQWYVARPLRHIHDSIERFRKGDAEARARLVGWRETREIAEAFNELTSTLVRQRQNQLAFLAGVAHDLRNPLSALKMKVHSLGRIAAGPGERTDTLSLLERQIDRMNRMLNDLLDATRIEAGSFQLQLAEMDLRQAARDIVDLYAPTSAAHRVCLEVPEQPVRLQADLLRVEQVVSNLVSNAIKYSPGGGTVVVEVGRTEKEALLVVRDQGLGIPADEVNEIFMPFRRRLETQDVAPGAGLGLSVVRRIVVAHGGRIEVESRPGSGSTFRVWLPFEPPRPASSP